MISIFFPRSVISAIKMRLPGGQIWQNTVASIKNYLHNPFENIFFQDFLFWSLTYFFSGRIRDKLGYTGLWYNTIIREARSFKVKKILADNDEITIDGMNFRLPDGPIERADLFGMLYDILPHTGPLNTEDRFFQYFSEGPYETDYVKIKDGDVVIDAGANIGAFAIMAAKKGAYVYAFEPQEDAITILEKNIKRNGLQEKISIVKLGLFDKKCSMSFVLEKDCIASSAISENIIDSKKKSVKIDCSDLDTWIENNNVQKVNFIKADIEGAERYLLVGAKKTIQRNHPKLSICTYHHPDDPEFLEKIIIDFNPSYKIHQSNKKLYAW